MTDLRCPLCDPDKTLVVIEGSNILIIKSPWSDDDLIVTLKDHRVEPTSDEYREAIDLARVENPNAMFGDCYEAVGHWAARIIKINKVGSSRMYKDKG